MNDRQTGASGLPELMRYVTVCNTRWLSPCKCIRCMIGMALLAAETCMPRRRQQFVMLVSAALIWSGAEGRTSGEAGSSSEHEQDMQDDSLAWFDEPSRPGTADVSDDGASRGSTTPE